MVCGRLCVSYCGMTALGVCGGICLNPSSDWVMHIQYVCVPFGLHGTDVERPVINKIISVSISKYGFQA
jgi:hypothetical protein